MKKSLLLLLFVVFLIPVYSIDLDKVEKLIFQFTNEERLKRNLPAYVFNEDLQNIARIHSKNMVKHHFFSHTDQNGRSPQDRKVIFAHNLLGGVGENIAYHHGTSEQSIAKNLMQVWMNSPPHRANILSKTFTHLGNGLYQKGDYFYATQNFGDLQAKLMQGYQRTLKYEKTQTFTFQYLGIYPKERLTIFLFFPDKKARYYLPNGTFYTGLGLLQPEWQNDQTFTLTFTFKQGKGEYQLVMGFDGQFYPEGIVFSVK
ncbi:MAG: CAP domain-containing protein [Spirochaetes bacterium]|nr:CAP domain-containing protein [Spirochaetota bacterium]